MPVPAFLNWLLRLLPTNPICLRLIQGGSVRVRHLYIRAGYLAIIIVVLLFRLLQSVGSQDLSLRELAGAGAQMFHSVSYLQVTLICLLTPVFMAGAIAQEANPRTWDILLTTPLNNLQIVLGNLFGRLFFVVALLFSSLPLFAVTQYFGGVPGNSIFASYAIAGTSALLVAAIAVTLSVTRTAGRRAVFVFYISVVVYLSATFAADLLLRTGALTTAFTPLNPFLALRVLLESNTYMPHDFTGVPASWVQRVWMGRPIATFCWLCVLISIVLVLFSTLRMRVVGTNVGQIPWYRRMLGLAAKGALERPARSVGRNPITWREAVARGKSPLAIIARWGLPAAGVVGAIIVVTLFHTGAITSASMQIICAAILTAEVAFVALAALQMSATAVSREREDGTLDIILTTPIQPGPYIQGKHRGLLLYLVPMILLPLVTMAIFSLYVATGGLGREGGVMVTPANPLGTGTFTLPVILPEGVFVLPLVLIPFVAFCVMVGLHWSIKSKGTIGSIIGAVAILVAVLGVIGLCGMGASKMSHVGSVVTAFSPVNTVIALVFPASSIPSALNNSPAGARTSLLIGAALSAVTYAAISYGMHSNMKRTFMMTVRKLAGTN